MDAHSMADGSLVAQGGAQRRSSLAISTVSSALLDPPHFSPSEYIQQLRFLLKSLHPALASIAEPLTSAGVRDLRMLVRFLGLSERMREAVFVEVKVPVLQRRLLRAMLGEAKEARESQEVEPAEEDEQSLR